jgi:cysteine desulfurase
MQPSNIEICNKLGYYDEQSKPTNLATDGVIYADYQATTPVDKRVIDAMIDAMQNNFGNPHSRSHVFGWKAEAAIDEARSQVADVIGAKADEVIFTSGATESNNIAIKGVAKFYRTEQKNHVVTLVTEHKCVIESCRFLQQEGFEVTFLKPKSDGLVDLQELEDAMTSSTILCSIMAVHNEIGVIQDLEKIGAICRNKGVFFHTDAAQAFGKIPLDVEKMNIDLLSISGHKIYGPKGVGALYIRKKPRIRLTPIFSGGGQERGIRSGTLPTSLIVGLGVAAKIATTDFATDNAKITALSNQLYGGLASIEKTFLNGSLTQRYCGNLNFSFAYVEGESLIMSISKIAVSSGSACTSASLEPSYVLKALGLPDEIAHSSIRFGIGRFTTKNDIDVIIASITNSVSRLRDLSPLWEMYKEGIDVEHYNWNSSH